MYDLDTEKRFGIATDEVHQSLNQVLGFAAARAYEDLIASMYVAGISLLPVRTYLARSSLGLPRDCFPSFFPVFFFVDRGAKPLWL